MRISGGVRAALFSSVMLVACGERQEAAHPQDSFRARIATDCTSEESCIALGEEAKQRFSACEANGGGRPCDSAQEDMIEIGRRHHEVRAANERAGRTDDQRARLANLRSMNEASRMRAVEVSLNGSCDDAKKIDEALAASPPELPAEERSSYATQLRATSAERRRFLIKLQGEEIERMARNRLHVVDLENPDDAMAPVEAERARVAALRCEGRAREGIYRPAGAIADDVAPVQAKLDAWAAPVAKMVADEKACRTSTECMAERLAGPICETIRNRKENVQAMARERANPSGYMDTALLHDLGSAIQNADVEIAGMKRDFKATTKKEFSDSRCQTKR